MLKTTARVQEGVKNSKYDPSVLPITDDPIKIRAQVEFYFSDTNLPTDRFLWGLTGGSSNVPVPIKKICEFGRMRRFSPYSSIVSALKESQLLKVSGEDGEEVIERRIPFNPDESRKTSDSRSIYAKGFGDEEAVTQFEIEAFFAPYGPINAVRLRRTFKKLFKGSVFVEFANEELAQKFLNLPDKPLWKGQYELLIMSKNAYMELKKDEFNSRGKNSNSKEYQNKGKGRDRGRESNRGKRTARNNHRGKNGDQGNQTDPDNWKKRREEDRASGFKNDRLNTRGRKGRNNGRQDLDENNKADSEIDPGLPQSNKRLREDDDEAEHSPTKKNNTKSDVALETEASHCKIEADTVTTSEAKKPDNKADSTIKIETCQPVSEADTVKTEANQHKTESDLAIKIEANKHDTEADVVTKIEAK